MSTRTKGSRTVGEVVLSKSLSQAVSMVDGNITKKKNDDGKVVEFTLTLMFCGHELFVEKFNTKAEIENASAILFAIRNGCKLSKGGWITKQKIEIMLEKIRG